MPFFEDIGKKITNMSQSAIEKTKCSTEILRLNNQIREEQHLCKALYQQIGQQYAKQYATNPDPAFEPLMNQLHAAEERIASYQEQVQIKKAASAQPPLQPESPSNSAVCPNCGQTLSSDTKFCTVCGASVIPTPPETEEPTATETKSPAPTITCLICGQKLSSDTKFCTACGASVIPTPPKTEEPTAAETESPAPTITCPNCGQTLSSDAKFCPICGGKTV